MGKKGKKGLSDLRFLGINLLVAMVVTVVLIGGLIVYLRAYTQHGVEVEVEDVRGLLVNEAEPILAAKGLHMEVVDSTYSDKVPFGAIVEQDPVPNSHAKHGRSVYVTINATTRRKVVIPDLQDMSYRQATTTLRSLGLVVDPNYEYRPSTYRDLVLDVKTSKGSLHPGEKVSVGTKVRLVVGKGKGTEYVQAPDVIGLTLQDARSKILRKRLTVGAVHYDEPPKEGVKQYVYNQKPYMGETLLEGETVALWLSTDLEKAVTSAPSSEDERWF